MAYTVLARKYRSWTFDELIGQEAVATTLKNAIQSGRIHHGHLFCGTRGVGKTSTARIFARSLNCLSVEAPTIDPCRQCESCVAISEGQDIDVIEIDAASNTGVDNIRELRSNANYRPARSRFKIYIIDEVHMLSTGAFNALLKTLEEPPPHIKFMLATTEPQKVPATIQSRCLRFDFRTISVDEISGHFQWILEQEKVRADEAVVRRVARLANGSMRDGLSLLDQLLSTGGDELTMEMIDDILPVPHDEVLMELIGQLADHDSGGALTSLDKCLSGGYSLDRFTEALAEQVRTLMLLNVCGGDSPLVELPGSVRESMVETSKRFDPESFVYIIAVLEELRRNIRFSSMGRALMEAGIVKLAHSVSYRSIQSLIDEIGEPGGDRVSAKKKVAPPAPNKPAGGSDPKPESRRSQGPAKTGAAPSATGSKRATPKPTTGKKAPPAQGSNGKDMLEASKEPMVREALELFDGSLVNVERVGKKDRPK